eukprot:518298_1
MLNNQQQIQTNTAHHVARHQVFATAIPTMQTLPLRNIQEHMELLPGHGRRQIQKAYPHGNDQNHNTMNHGQSHPLQHYHHQLFSNHNRMNVPTTAPQAKYMMNINVPPQRPRTRSNSNSYSQSSASRPSSPSSSSIFSNQSLASSVSQYTSISGYSINSNSESNCKSYQTLKVDGFRKKQTQNRSDTQRRITYRLNNEVFKIWDYYKPTKVIGCGAYGVVIEAIDTRSNTKIAIKKNKNIFVDLEDSKRIYREMRLMQHFHHQNVINLLDIIPPSSKERNDFNELYLVMPRLESNLKNIIVQSHSQALTPTNNASFKLHDYHRMFIVFQLLCALQYIHSAGVIHRDLTPENVLVDSKLHIKIIDFGLSRGAAQKGELLTEYVCTRWYRAPEIMVSRQRYDCKVDVWSVGCIWAEMLLGRPLFQSSNHFELLNLMFSILGTPMQTQSESDCYWITDKDALNWMKTLNTSGGCDLRKLFNNTVPEAVDVLSKMLTLNPHQRCSVDDSLSAPYFHRYQQYFRQNKQCKKPFATKLQTERAMNTPFGSRSIMYDELVQFRPKTNNDRKIKRPSTPSQSYSFMDSPK